VPWLNRSTTIEAIATGIREKELPARVPCFRRQPPKRQFGVAISRAGSGVRNQASLFFELRRVDLAASETLLQDFQGGGCCNVGFVLVRGTAPATTLGAIAAVLAATFAFGFRLRLRFLHCLSPVMPDLARLDIALDFRNAVGCRRKIDAGSGDELRRFMEEILADFRPFRHPELANS
jgi:hypothetical protein